MPRKISWLSRCLFGSWVGAVAVVSVAHADVAPPAGQKYAQYGFRVENMASFADWTLVAYPCSISSGTPYQLGTAITTDAVVNVGRRGGTCAMYAMKRSEWTSWRAANPAPTDYANDTKLGDLVASGKMLTCQGSPQPRFVVASSAPDTITDTLRVEKLDATTCSLVLKAEQGQGDPSPTVLPPVTLDCGVARAPSRSTPVAGWSLWGLAMASAAMLRRRALRKRAG